MTWFHDLMVLSNRMECKLEECDLRCIGEAQPSSGWVLPPRWMFGPLFPED